MLEGNVEEAVRNEAAYRLARIHFQKDQLDEALHALDALAAVVHVVERHPHPDRIAEEEPLVEHLPRPKGRERRIPCEPEQRNAVERLPDGLPHRPNIESYIRIVKDKAVLRVWSPTPGVVRWELRLPHAHIKVHDYMDPKTAREIAAMYLNAAREAEKGGR